MQTFLCLKDCFNVLLQQSFMEEIIISKSFNFNLGANYNPRGTIS